MVIFVRPPVLLFSTVDFEFTGTHLNVHYMATERAALDKERSTVASSNWRSFILF